MTEVSCRTFEDLKSALGTKAVRIRVTDPRLAKKVLLVMNLDKAVVIASLGAIGFAVANATTTVLIPVEVATTGGVSSVVRFGASGVTVMWLATQVGWPAAAAIFSVAVGLGGVGLLTLLVKSYSVKDWSPKHVVLVRR
jgi:hypothetical protein